MSKFNAFAAILKFINGSNERADSLRAVCSYTTDKAKTSGGTLIATQGCSPEHPVEDMLANKRLHNKTHGKQYEHFVLAPCANGSDKSPEDILRVTKEIVATVFPENMAIITVHTDTKFVHSHTVIDSVNAVTGRKFSQSPSDLNRIKQKVNSILEKNGFEIITASANEFVDHTDYSAEKDFNFLELDESKLITETMVAEISSFTGSVSLTNTSTLFSGWDYSCCEHYNYGGNTMNNDYTPYVSQPQAIPATIPTAEPASASVPMVQQTQEELPVSTATAEAVPDVIETGGNNYPNTSVVTGPTFRINGTPDSNFAGLSELVKQATDYAQEHQRDSANLALAMQQYGQQNGYPTNVSVYAGPIFYIDLAGGLYPPMPGYGNNKY